MSDKTKICKICGYLVSGMPEYKYCPMCASILKTKYEERCCFCQTDRGALIQLYQGWCCVNCFKKYILNEVTLGNFSQK
jgi:hypothetical protein